MLGKYQLNTVGRVTAGTFVEMPLILLFGVPAEGWLLLYAVEWPVSVPQAIVRTKPSPRNDGCEHSV